MGDLSGFRRSVSGVAALCVIVVAVLLLAAGPAFASGSVAAWGGNTYGQCNVPSPNTGFVAVAAGACHSLGLKSDGSIAAWGYNGHGQCSVPSPNTGFVAVAAGCYHSLGLRADGSIAAWSWNYDYYFNYAGQCDVPSPNTGFVAVAAGGWHSLGLRAGGSIAAWGDNTYNQCSVPTPNTGFVAVAAGTWHNLALRADGSIAAWGDNTYGQCSVPSPNTGFAAVAAGGSHSLGLRADGSIAAWGYNYYGQCDVPSPNTGFVAVGAGMYHSLGLRADGSIAAWGWNGYGQCNVPSPNTGFVAVAAGYSHSLGIRRTPWLVLYYMCNGGDLEGGIEAKFRAISDQAANPNLVAYLLWDHVSGEDRVFQMKNDPDWLSGYTRKVDYWTATDIGLPSAEMDTGDVNTLNAFVDFVLGREAPDHYALIVFNHGGGVHPTVAGPGERPVITGIAFDDTSYLSIQELGQGCAHVRSAIGRPFEVLHLDACLMQMIEIDHEVRNACDYVVATENEGWTYTGGTSWEWGYLDDITNSTSAEALANAIAADYFDEFRSSGATISNLSCSQAGGVSSPVDTLAGALVRNIWTIRAEIQSARNDAQKFAYYDVHNTMTQSNIFLDLRDLCEEIVGHCSNQEVRQAASGVIAAVGNAGGNFVRFEGHQSAPGATPNSGYYFEAGTYGVSIFFPESPLDVYYNYVNASSTPANLAFCADTQWDEFLQAYLGWPSVPAVKLQPDGALFRAKGAIVTAVFGDAFYIEADNRECGIRVETAGHALEPDMRADIAGVVKTNLDGERFIEAATAAQSSPPNGIGHVDPLGLANRTVGGGDFAYDAGPPKCGQQGVTDGAGLNNIALLIRSAGRVTQIGPDYLYINDGSNVKDGTMTGEAENVGVRVICAPTGYSAGDFLIVTGISSCFGAAPSQVARRILTRRAEDVSKLAP
jgi:hypothetical protein